MAFLRRLARRQPLLSNVLAYGTMFVGAEFCQQTIMKRILVKDKEKPPEPYDMESVRNYALLGYSIQPTILYYWYKLLDRKLPGTTTSVIVRKVFLDLFFIGPINIFIFFTAMALLERQADIFAEHRKKYIDTVLKQVYVWAPIQTINFWIVPAKLRVVYVGMASFLWLNLLCYIKRSPIHDEKKHEKEDGDEAV